ncbi:MAG: hypothetical protein KBH07_04615 [Flavobacteriales bacterium]|nr:hypothetical protein [Flavobacteriales bacterium]MBP9080194.1 hypothetical protein [Flavobacteriales bacterium]
MRKGVRSFGRLTAPLAAAAMLATLGSRAQGPTTGSIVLNGGFEVFDKAPNTFDQLSRADGWEHVTIGMAEAFTKGASVKTVGIPENFYGTMEPFEGEHYAGFVAWKDDQRNNFSGDPEDPFLPGWNAYSEYPITELPITLKEGHTYEISFHVALAASSDRAMSGIGALVTPLKLRYQNRSFLSERPQVVEEKILEERGKWVEVTGRFTADGNERYLVIGTFPTAIFETKRIIEGPDNQYAYYYLDGVSLREVPAGERAN